MACTCHIKSIATDTITTREAVKRIADQNPKLNAFAAHRTLNNIEDSNGSSGPLRDWPIAVKANIAMSWTPTSCASKELENYMSPFQATVVDSLEAAGANIVGKTNMDEFGMGSHNTFSVHGPVRNPQYETHMHSPGGSSGGSAAAVAAGMCRAALGSDTGGSVRLPAAWCGVVGFKPTYGRISRHGLVSYGSSLDTIGILARNVADVKTVYEAIAVPDTNDMTCMSLDLRQRIKKMADSQDRIKNSSKDSTKPLTGIRVGIPKEFWVSELSQQALDSWRAGADRLASLGCEVVAVSLPHIPNTLPVYYTLAWAEASSNLSRYDGIRYGRRSNTKYSDGPMESASQKFAQTRSEGLGDEVQRRILLGSYVMSSAASKYYFTPSQKIRRLVQQEFDSVFEFPNLLLNNRLTEEVRDERVSTHGVDVLLFLTATDTAPCLNGGKTKSDRRVSNYVNDVMTVPANLAGIPAISVPAFTNSSTSSTQDNMPLGLQLAAQYGDDNLLLHIASFL